MDGDMISLFVNAGIAGVFAIFAIILQKNNSEYLNKSDERWRVYMERRDETFTASLDKVSNSLESNTRALIDNTVLLARHDESSDKFFAELGKISKEKKN